MQQKIKEIKKVSLMLFNERGYESTTMRDISEGVGITAPSIYFYYKSKQDLFLELFNESNELFTKRLEEAIAQNKDQPADEQLFQMFSALVYFNKINTESMKFFIRFTNFPVSGLKEKIHSISELKTNIRKNAIVDVFTKRIEKGKIKNYTAHQCLTSFYTLFFGYIMTLIRFEIDVDDDKVCLVWEQYWKGISCKNE